MLTYKGVTASVRDSESRSNDGLQNLTLINEHNFFLKTLMLDT